MQVVWLSEFDQTKARSINWGLTWLPGEPKVLHILPLGVSQRLRPHSADWWLALIPLQLKLHERWSRNTTVTTPTTTGGTSGGIFRLLLHKEAHQKGTLLFHLSPLLLLFARTLCLSLASFLLLGLPLFLLASSHLLLTCSLLLPL